MSLILILVIFVVVFCFIKLKYKLYLVGSRICGPSFLESIRMVARLKPQYLLLFASENRAKYRKTFRLWVGPQLWVFLHSAKETQDALNNKTLVRADTFHQLNVLIGNGLLISEGKYWETHRRALGPAFHPYILNTFSPVLCRHSYQLVSKIECNLNESMEASELLFPCILDSIIETSMGKVLNAQLNANETFSRAFHTTTELLFKRMVNPLLAFDFVFKRTRMYKELKESLDIIHDLTDEVIKERALALAQRSQENTNSAEKKYGPLLDTLLTTPVDGTLLTHKEIHDEVNTFLLAGVDTTTAAMSFILYALAKFPDEQERVFNEIEIFLQANESSEQFNSNLGTKLSSLVYLDLFIKECLRFYTVVPMTGRQTTKSTKIGETEYCAGVTLWINMYGLAHDETLFEDAAVFNPMRFSKKYSDRQIQPFSYLPFSSGPHICIGRKYALLIMKILTVHILKKFKLSLRAPNEELILMTQMVLKSLNGINLIFTKRS